VLEEDIAMKRGMIWMALAAVVLVSTSAWAVWNPDTDPDRLFNMNFETGTYDNGAHTATDVVASLVGTVIDYNTANPNVFGEETTKAGLGHDANFAQVHDLDIGSPNDCKLSMALTGIFDLGNDDTVKSTWTFWFNVPSLTDGTIIRHASIYLENEGYENLLWEIRIHGGKLHFYHKNNSLRMETASTLSDLGVTVNEWHSAAVVIDREDTIETSVPTTQLSSKIYIDGLEAPIIVSSVTTASMNIDAYPYYDSPLWIGAGERQFDGLLDDVRLFGRVLTPVEVSILNQPDKTLPRALLPIPRSSNVLISTDVNWIPAVSTPLPTAQKVYFGTDTDPNNLPLKKTILNGTTHIATNTDIGGPLNFNTKYYWYIQSTIGGNDVNGPVWSFTTETGKAINPSPADGAEDIDSNGLDLSWTTPTAATYAVYLSQDWSLVDSNDISVRIADSNSNPFKNDVFNTSIRGAIYYWRVNSTYTSGTIPGDIWSFRTKPYELVFNTSGYSVAYADHAVAAYGCEIHGGSPSWTTVTTGSLDGNYMADGNAIAVFDFDSGFNYNRRYDIIVVPQYNARDINKLFVYYPTPLAIHVTGDFYFDGRVQIAGEDILSTTQDLTVASSGGYPGPKHNNGDSIFGSSVPGNSDIDDYWDHPTMKANNHTRVGSYTSSKDIYIPTELCKKTFGPGQPVNPPYKGGGGGGYGGVGGEAGRGYYTGIFSGGPNYGDEEVPIPFGGSSGGWGSAEGGAAGGGGIEIIATGNVVLDANSEINAYGGSQAGGRADYPGGGGAGGSVRIIASGSVTNKGAINVNGGKGGDATGSGNMNDTGGGGAGGRVAIFYGTTKDLDDGTITADGGAKGTDLDNTALAQDGENGTIFIRSFSEAEPNRASAPTPADGDEKVYCSSDPCTIQLKWYSGYNVTPGTDEVFCDTNPNPSASQGSVAATRGQHSVNMTVYSGNTYYWKVVTDGTISSDIWSFTTVDWYCPFAISNRVPHVGGPEWDFNHNCIIDIEDFAFFVKDWLNSGFGGYMLTNDNFADFAAEWRMCDNRSDGCNDWPD